MRVLLVEDDAMIGRSLRQALLNEGMSVDWTMSGLDGENSVRLGAYAAILLDLGLPDTTGFDILRRLRAGGDQIPIIVLTARDAVEDRIAGLDLGADDYIVKPFDVRELIARIRAVIRRRAGAAQPMLQTSALTLDLGSHELAFGQERRILSAREFALMRALMERPGTILSRSQIEERIYGWGEEVESNAVDVLIHSLRKRFGKDLISNVRGAGWMVMKG
ncbi:response regulator transcription factor [Lichenifustis flavocetrariae]|uniref:Response regulator transcription factor n=1 Tax=Lichenifustis flavocetrariae TaxID=2949735 RepID=A0AA42CN28_9HYPH|nr:response regulator transcription factor [Lichenifustis flavocetrariae]MCW6513113.1 response regulator transcription factor [Lichenifustis flavocetrariae]